MGKKLLVFDLDGTLADTSRNIAAAVNHTLRQLGLEELPNSTIISFIGNGSKRLIAGCLEYHRAPQLYDKALEFLFPYYYENVEAHTHLYRGVADTLAQFSCPKTVLTNKPGAPAVRLLQFLEISHHFAEIVGGDCSERLKPDPRNLEAMIARYGESPADTYVIGDSPVDIEVAHNAGANAIAVTYGFNDKERLHQAGAKVFVDDFAQLPKVLSMR